MPRRHLPEENASRLKGGRLPEKEQDAPPLRAFPGDVGPDKKGVCDHGSKAAEGCDEPELAHLFPEVEIEIDGAEAEFPMPFREAVFERKARCA
jgi:hypothetical protein